MPLREREAGFKGELHDLLCLLSASVFIWLIGQELHVFSFLSAFAQEHGLTDIIMLGFCMSFALTMAAFRKSRRLRDAVMARDAAQLDAETIARHDPLTGLANRRFFHEMLTGRLNDRESAKSVAVLLIDLDRFKPINDVHGHAAGDAVLCSIANRLRSVLPPSSIAARLGGDEFAVILTSDTDVESLGPLANNLITELSRPIAWAQSRLTVGATIGVAVRTSDDEDGDALLHAADVAMYEGKKDGRGTYRVFRQEMSETLRARSRLERELRDAIDSGQIEPYYQPLVALSDSALIGFEVLARWRHPVRGLLSPSDFIAVAEETGMIDELCRSLLRQACFDAKAWPEHLQLSINIAPQQLYDRRLIDNIAAVLAETGFRADRLEVELTETALVTNLELARLTLNALRKLGVRIALDDFGTGYSSLYHLRELKFDKLKIDRSYVELLAQGGDRVDFIDAIISLGRSLGMDTIAEGVESLGSVEWLLGRGCTYGQGHLFGRAMTSQDVEQLIHRPVASVSDQPHARAA